MEEVLYRQVFDFDTMKEMRRYFSPLCTSTYCTNKLFNAIFGIMECIFHQEIEQNSRLVLLQQHLLIIIVSSFRLIMVIIFHICQFCLCNLQLQFHHFALKSILESIATLIDNPLDLSKNLACITIQPTD